MLAPEEGKLLGTAHVGAVKERRGRKTRKRALQSSRIATAKRRGTSTKKRKEAKIHGTGLES